MEVKNIDEPDHSFKYYSLPSIFLKIVSNRKKIFCTWAFIGYIGQFLLCVSALNVYSDNDRHSRCGSSLTDPHVDPSKFYDMALYLISIYHIIEFVRFTLFMTCAFLEVNMMWIWYILYLNTLYGLASYIIVHKARFDMDGKACADI